MDQCYVWCKNPIETPPLSNATLEGLKKKVYGEHYMYSHKHNDPVTPRYWLLPWFAWYFLLSRTRRHQIEMREAERASILEPSIWGTHWFRYALLSIKFPHKRLQYLRTLMLISSLYVLAPIMSFQLSEYIALDELSKLMECRSLGKHYTWHENILLFADNNSYALIAWHME